MLFKPETEELKVTPHGNVTPFADCPACGCLIKLEPFQNTALKQGRHCPSCNVFIDRHELEKSGDAYLRVVKALESAAQLAVGKGILLIVFGQAFFQMLLFYDMKYTFFVQVLCLSSLGYLISGYWSVQKWLDEFGHLVVKDEEFTAAKNEMKRTRLIWVTATILNLILWFIYLKFL